jgi:hypothetical protein
MKSMSDVLFLQEPPWATMRYTPSLIETDRVPVKGPLIHLDWIAMYPKGFDLAEDWLCVLAYINCGMHLIKPKLCKWKGVGWLSAMDVEYNAEKGGTILGCRTHGSRGHIAVK